MEYIKQAALKENREEDEWLSWGAYHANLESSKTHDLIESHITSATVSRGIKISCHDEAFH